MMSPMMQHYMETKKEYSDCILFYRLGDFYEMFFDDAITVSRELELTLTGKDCGLPERAPMCGVPFHAVDGYLNRLVGKGYKVAIAEQMEDPKTAKGLVKREVIRVVTPGTISGENVLDESRNNYLCAVRESDAGYGLCLTDITTGDFRVTQVEELGQLMTELTAYAPAELLCTKAMADDAAFASFCENTLSLKPSLLDDSYFQQEAASRLLTEHFHVHSTEGLGLSDLKAAAEAAGAVLRYLYDTQKHDCGNITELKLYQIGEFMILDSATRRNLELVETMRQKERRGSLLWVLDKTETAMGARMLRSWLEKPLVRKDSIRRRQDAVEELFAEYIIREELREYLKPVYDLERLMGRISSGLANARDLAAFRGSAEMLGPIRNVLGECRSELLRELYERLDPLEDLLARLKDTLAEDPPLTLHDGGLIRPGCNAQVDELRAAKTDGKSWLAELESRERERTGIKNLKVRFNKVFGYYLEVTNSFKDLVPEDYIRKQTLVGSERYTTEELKHMEEMILGSEDRLYTLEYDLFSELRQELASQVGRIQASAAAVAECDVLMSLAVAAYQNNYVRPSLNTSGRIEISGGRHPVVEKMIGEERFVANDTHLDLEDSRIDIITGPNMAGKSTYMRQVALICLMAQTGSFVPAASAEIGLCDRIFTRVGASDDLAAGQSTFMVEMSEVANILRSATSRSLIIMDEIGRGTSTFDGLSIAWAVVEYISDRKLLGARTLFATHYHELTELEGILDGVHNYCVSVSEHDDDIIFLRKIVRGGADKSYGIQVARLAGLPESVLARAKMLVTELSGSDIAYQSRQAAERIAVAAREPAQMTLLAVHDDDTVIEKIRDLDLSRMTPIEALNELYKIQELIRNRV